jgi:hypothetical protein
LTYEEPLDAAISSLFDDARKKLGQVNEQAKETKKHIIIDLAKNLEGKIPTDTISIKIVNQLRDQVSERFIHECLDEKYKQKSRVENARKQKKRPKEPKVINKLAALSPLNQEVEEADKKVIILDANGRIIIQEDENGKPSTSTSITTNTPAMTSKTFTFDLYQQSFQEQEQEIKKDIDSQEKECIIGKDLSFENGQLKKVIEKLNQSIQSENMVSSTTLIKNNQDIIDNILSCEFFMLFKKIRKYMTPQYSRVGDAGKIWFNVKIDRDLKCHLFKFWKTRQATRWIFALTDYSIPSESSDKNIFLTRLEDAPDNDLANYLNHRNYIIKKQVKEIKEKIEITNIDNDINDNSENVCSFLIPKEIILHHYIHCLKSLIGRNIQEGLISTWEYIHHSTLTRPQKIQVLKPNLINNDTTMTVTTTYIHCS